jgi:hypothetical protein
MELITSYENGNRSAKVYSDPISGYTVEYIINQRIVNKTHHISLSLAEDVADDFIAEAGSNPTFLND